jgi:hypothetical protein
MGQGQAGLRDSLRLMDRFDPGAERRYWIPEQGTEWNIDDIQEDLG